MQEKEHEDASIDDQEFNFQFPSRTNAGYMAVLFSCHCFVYRPEDNARRNIGIVDPVLEIVQEARTSVMCVRNKGPRQAMEELARTLNNDEARARWAEEARLAAIVGSCPKSKSEQRSGMRCWIDFARNVFGN